MSIERNGSTDARPNQGPRPHRSMVTTEELNRRPTRAPQHEAESRALVTLAQAMAASPENILQKLAETALELCGAHSAGLSLLEEADQKQNFYWRVIVGAWEHNIGGGTPRDFGPCGDVLDAGVTLVCQRPEQDFPYWSAVQPPLDEGLLIPFSVNGECIGTIWVISHDESRRFDREDLRLMESLGAFTGAAYQAWRAVNAAQRLAAIVETSDDAIIGKSADGRIMSWNGGAERMFGYSAGEAVGQSIDLVVPPDWQEEEKRNLARVARGERIEPFESVRRRKDGTHLTVSVSASAVMDGHGRIVGSSQIARDITERKHAEHEREFLLREVNHRAQNMLGLVQSIARATAGPESGAFLDTFGERIQALSANQRLLVNSGWKGVDIEALVRSQLAHFKDFLDNRIKMHGPPLVLSAKASQTFGMALHELATNAGKYGALSTPHGRVDIGWEIVRALRGPVRFRITWQEAGGPQVRSPQRTGFGSDVIGAAPKMNLGAEVDLDFAPTGVRWRLECPLDRIAEEQSAKSALQSGDGLSSNLEPEPGAGVLVVEDDWLVASEVVGALKQAGHQVVGPVASVADAMEMLDRVPCQAAVLDINLGRETSAPIAERLAAQGTPFLALTGYDVHQLPANFESVPRIGKPVRLNALVAEVDRMLRGGGRNGASVGFGASARTNAV